MRQPEIYGTTTASELDKLVQGYAIERNIETQISYTNSEAELIDLASSASALGFEAIVCNTGSFCYASYSIRDCFGALSIPVIEVHMSNQLAREIHSITAEGATGVIMGFGHDTYLIGLDVAVRLATKNKETTS
jgi:3-dehydroquinate dehydratase-2